MPKVFDNLYPQITDFGNLHEAWRKAAKGKRNNPGGWHNKVSRHPTV